MRARHTLDQLTSSNYSTVHMDVGLVRVAANQSMPMSGSVPVLYVLLVLGVLLILWQVGPTRILEWKSIGAIILLAVALTGMSAWERWSHTMPKNAAKYVPDQPDEGE